jgi:hypothetical protein
MTQEHPITPPPELVNLWMSEDAPWDSDSFGVLTARPSQLRHIATQAARWGADQELDACRLWVSENCDIYSAVELIQFRRPKPPSLKEQALEQLDGIAAVFRMFHGGDLVCDKIRRALEALPDD